MAQVIKRAIGLRRDWLGGELSHQQTGSAIVGMSPEVTIENRFRLREFPLASERSYLVKARCAPDRPADSQGSERGKHKHQGDHQEDRASCVTIHRRRWRNSSLWVISARSKVNKSANLRLRLLSRTLAPCAVARVTVQPDSPPPFGRVDDRPKPACKARYSAWAQERAWFSCLRASSC